MNTWKQKLAAYLHDPPSKCLDIRTHGERSAAAFRQAGFSNQEIEELSLSHKSCSVAAGIKFRRKQHRPFLTSTNVPKP